jgi:hypothetical protein
MNKEYKTAIIVLIVSIIIVLIFNLAVREKLKQDESFSALYFEDHKKLPKKLLEDENYSIEFTISNQELKTTKYKLVIDSKTYPFEKEIYLNPNELKTFKFNIKVKNEDYYSKFSISQEKTKIIEKGFFGKITENIFIKKHNDYNTNNIIDNKNNKYYLPLSFNLGTFGQIYHINLTVNELKDKPFYKKLNYLYTNYQIKTNITEEITFYYNNKNSEKIHTNIKTNEIIEIKLKKPFIVKVIKDNNNSKYNKLEELEIHFWYETIN